MLFMASTTSYAQCAYTELTSPQVGLDYTFCIDNSNTITTASVNAGRYVVVNVVKGFNYTFSVGNVFTGSGNGNRENLTLFDASNNSDFGNSGYNRGQNGASITWTSSISGQIKVMLSKNCVNDNSTGGALTLTLNSVGNTQDSQNAFGTNQWVGHVYNLSGGSAIPPGGTSPAAPTASDPFIDANYVGYYNVGTESISEGFGGDNVCFPVTSAATNIYTDKFAVRYRMRSTKTGCYFLNVSGDDGIRVYVDGVLVFNAWVDQGPTDYCNNLIYLSGASDIVFDYYENGGQNIAKFSLTEFAPSTNTIAGTATRTVCSGVTPGLLDGSAYAPCTTSSISNVTFQWQVSTDNVSFTDISGATSEDYTPPTQTTTTNIVRYYRRVLKASASNVGSCEFYTNVITISVVPPTVAGTVSAAQTICSGTQPASLILSGQIGSVVKWQKATDIGFTTGLVDINNTTTTLLGTTIGNLTVNTYFRAVVQSGACSVVNTVPVLIQMASSTVGNNTLSYTNGTSGQRNGDVDETDSMSLTASTGTYFAQVNFASYGTPTGSSPNFAINPVCHATTSQSLTETYLLGKTGLIAIPATNAVFGDPCSGTRKRLKILASYAQPICYGATVTINGSTPNGGTGTYIYEWQSSTTSATAGFASAAGTNNAINYTTAVLNQDTWFRRVVNSCTSSTSTVVLVKVNPIFTAGSIQTTGQTICNNTVPTTQIGNITTATGGDNSITYQWQYSTDSTFGTGVNTVASNSSVYTPTQTLTQTTYYRRLAKDNTCSTTFTASAGVWVVSVTQLPASPGIITGAIAQCAGNTSQTYSIASVANATSYVWTVATASGWIINSGQGTNSITVTIGSSSANVSVNTINTCGIGYATGEGSGYKFVTVSSPTVAGTVTPENTNVCSGSNSTNLSLSGNTGSILRWESSLDNFAGGTITTISSSGSPITASNLTVDTYYRAVVQSGGCNLVYSNSVKISVSGNTATPGPITGSTTQCAGSISQVYSVSPVANATNYTWKVDTGSGWLITSGQGTNSIIVTVGTGSANISVNANNSCSIGYGPYQWIAVTAAPTATIAYAGSPYCRSLTAVQAVTQTGATGGTYTASSPGLSINTSTGAVTPSTSTAGTYTVTYAYGSGGCTGLTTTASVTISTVPAATISYAGSPYCKSLTSGAVTQIGTSGGVFTASSVGLTINSSTGTVTPSTSTAGTYIVTYTYGSGACAGQTTTASVTINDLPSTPTVGIVKQPTCAIPTGSFTITNYNASYTYTFSPSIGVIVNADKVTAPPGNYTFTAYNGSCSSTAVNVVINNQPATKTWNGSSWSPIGDPTIENPIIFTGDYNSASDLDACSCQVTSGAKVVINSLHTLTVTNSVDVVSGSTLTFENNASLLQTNDAAVNTGNITYKRNTDYVRRYDFTYWSSPVEKERLINVSPTTLGDKFYSYDSDNNKWVIHYNGNMEMAVGEGYLIRAPQGFSITVPAIDTAPKFIGKPNNGVITKQLTGGQLYLLGNPYPSALYADQFLFDNKDKLEGTLYFWTHNTPPSGTISAQGTYDYNSNDYASYNITGGVATNGVGTGTGLPAGTEPAADQVKNTPKGKIASGQGFFAFASAAGGDVKFDNGMRVAGNNTQFFRTKSNAKSKTAIEKNRLWLNLTNKQGAFKQTLVGYITGATNGYDNGYDGVSFDGNDFIDFYSVNDGSNFAIQGRTLPFDQADTVPLGYRSTIVGNFTVSIDQTDGLFDKQDIYIEDKLLNVVQDLKAASYNFTTQQGTFDDRFVLRYTDRTLGNEDFDALSSQIIVSRDKNELKIKSDIETIKKVTVYDLLGKKVFEKNVDNSTEFRSSTIGLSKQVGIVRITLDNGQVVSRKVSFY